MAKYSTVIVDEAQDINRVMLSLIKQLHSAHMVVYVRDQSQKIYSFIHCVDIGDHVEQEYTAWSLHVTFRFGQALCDYIEENQLSHTKTVASPDCPDTQIDYIDDCDIVPGAHTVLISAWEQILRTAERYMRAGRQVCIDEEKKQDLLNAVKCTGWSKYEWLFSRLPKARVAQILSDLVDDTDEGEDLILLSTVHMAKGLQYKVVRVSRCVLAEKHGDPDHRRKHYVAVTRAMELLFLPAAAISTAQKRKISL
jgi:superfamily I DNA/RNA helicase